MSLRHLLACSLVVALGVALLPGQESSREPSRVPNPKPHAVCATTPDLASLCNTVGGDRVVVTCFAKGPEDPHFLDARPSWIRAVNRAEALVEVGRELEIGWLPLLVDNGRNGAVLGGQPGRIVASDAVRALGVPTGPVDRSHGDVHAGGNPHFLVDPLCGLQVARLLAERFAALWPADREVFQKNFATFRQQVAEAMVGSKVAARYEHDAEQLAQLFPSGKLEELLKAQDDLKDLGGWFGELQPLRGSKVVADHDVWPYFAERFGLQVVGFLEPIPGVAPTTGHLAAVVTAMKAQQVRAILTTSYFAPQHAALVARNTGAAIAAMAHQAGARPGTDEYLRCVDSNVRAVVAALQAGRVTKQ